MDADFLCYKRQTLDGGSVFVKNHVLKATSAKAFSRSTACLQICKE